MSLLIGELAFGIGNDRDEEDVAVWRYGLAPDTGAARTTIDRSGAGSAPTSRA